MIKRRRLLLVGLSFSLIGLPQWVKAQERDESREERLRIEAEESLKEPLPTYQPFAYLPAYQLRQLLRLPTIARTGRLRKFDLKIADDFAITHRCDRHLLADANTDKNWEHNPSIEAVMPEIDFAPIAPGNAMLTFQGKLSVLGNTIKAEKGSVVPIVMQLQHKPETVTLSSYNGALGIGGYWAAARLDEEATHAVVFFVGENHLPIPTRWTNADGSKVGIALITIEREALVAAQPEKAKRELIEMEVKAKDNTAHAAAESVKLREEERARVETQARQKQLAEMDLRDWKNKSGKSWRAEFVEFKDGVVTLTTDQFEPIKVRFSELDGASLKQLRAILKANRSSEESGDK